MSILRHSKPVLPAVRLGSHHNKTQRVDALLCLKTGNDKPIYKAFNERSLLMLLRVLPDETVLTLICKLVNGQSLVNLPIDNKLYSVELIQKTK